MAFTYDLTATGDDLNVAKVRLEIGDTVSGTGVKPNGSNFTDAELLIFLARESNNVMRATASACEALARWWATAVNITVGLRREELTAVSKAWTERAAELRKQYGGGQQAFSAGVTRQDGYSTDVASDDVEDAETGEYGGVVRYVRL